MHNINQPQIVSYFILVSFNHIGDYNQALQIYQQLRLKYAYSINLQMVDVQKENSSQIIFKKQLDFIHSVGEKALIKLLQLKKQKQNIFKFIIVQIHQYFDEINQIKPNILIIPKLNFKDSQELKQTLKIFLMGTIFEKHSNEMLQNLYNSNSISKQLDKNKNYIIIMLSGDAPDQQQKINYFTQQSADLLLIRIIYHLGYLNSKGLNPQLIVQNGPRTGKYNPLTGQQCCLHKFNNGQNPQNAVDKISSYFIMRLKQYGLKYKFYNFSFQIFNEKRVINSFYKPLLHLAQQKQNIFFFPMQSISMCSQLPYYIPGNRLIAYHTSSTNKNHLNFVYQGFNNGLYKIIKQNEIKIENSQNQIQSQYDQTNKIMQVINKKISQKLLK